MRLQKKGTHALVAAAIIAAGLTPATPANAYHLEKERLSRELKETRGRLDSALDNEDEMQKIVREIDAKLQTQQRKLNAAQSEVAQVEHQIASTEARLLQLADDERTRRETVNERAAAIYMLGPMDTMTAVASSKSVEAFVGRAQAVNFIAAYDQRNLEDLAGIRYETKIGKITLREARAQARQVRARVSLRVNEVAAWRAEKQEALDRIAGSVDKYRSMIRALEAEQQRIQDIIAGRTTYAGAVYTGAASSLGFAWPINGYITSPYGPRWGGFHTGIDIDCDTGERIGASRAGTVIESAWGGGYGYMVIIDHHDGFSSLYAHNSRLLVGRGDRVERGSVVSLCGSTGNSTGDHSHFEIRYNGSHRNPRAYLP
jgi:murein DD-endopeptidase MepM/ murein hydrolase activator NlpD